ncbi:MAG: Ig-like domain-containing protein, partial [Methanoregula sp.]
MREKTGIFIIICLFFLIGTTTALIPDASTVTIGNSWVVANGVDRTTITVTALNGSAPVQNAIVQFTVDNPKNGSVSPLTNITNSIGEAKSTFRVNTTSGTVNITVRITADGHSEFRNVTVNIDHDSPYYPYFNHPLSGTVGTEVPFNISITDYWGNRIDNRKEVALGLPLHTISLHVNGPAPDDCNFVGEGHDISRALDPNGNLSVKVKLTTKSGPNNILMDTFGSIPDKLEWIDADNTGIPFSMYQIFSPSGSPPAIPADGESYFTIVYTLFDKYGNPTNGQWIWVNTSLSGEDKQFQSNNQGQITVQYGPRSSIGVIQITATSAVNNTVTLSQTVEFTHTGAKIISLTANPDAMASNDVPPSTAVANIIATVVDQSGNAVPGESVNFTIDNITYDGTYNITADPVLLNLSGITDVNGRAAVQFRPGAFTLSGNLGY